MREWGWREKQLRRNELTVLEPEAEQCQAVPCSAAPALGISISSRRLPPRVTCQSLGPRRVCGVLLFIFSPLDSERLLHQFQCRMNIACSLTHADF